MQVLAFPLRLRDNGLLTRQDQAASIVDLLHVMARTPAGSWQGLPAFGLRDLLEGVRPRVDVVRVATQRINDAFLELGIEGFVVTDMVREPSQGAEGDTYSITFSRVATSETFATAVSFQQ